MKRVMNRVTESVIKRIGMRDIYRVRSIGADSKSLRSAGFATFLSLIVMMSGSAHAQLSESELGMEVPEGALTELSPVSASDAIEVELEAIVELGYEDVDGRYVVDLLEQDQAYLGIRVTTPEGRPVVGAMPNISIEGTSRLVLQDIVSGDDGVLSFGVVGNQMGLDVVKASIGAAEVEIAINVISLRAAGFPTPQELDDGIPWSELMQARLQYKDRKLVATFPDSISAKAGQVVKLSGFMMPLEPTLMQKHFLLTSNPPSCFFHIPGGPAGSVEVVALEGIEVSTWDPIVIEGRFEPQSSSDIGVVYRLLDAKLVKP